MNFAIKAEVRDPNAKAFAFDAQKTMYEGKRVATGDTIFVFASENEGGSGLIARGIVTSSKPTPRKPGIERQTPRVSITVKVTARAKRRLGRAELKPFSRWNDGRPETELNFKYYRQATDKIVGLSDQAAAFLAGHFSKAKPVKLLSGGNPQIAKANGDQPVKAYIAAIPGWRRDVARRLDALVVRVVPQVRKAVKWNSPMYGIEEQGWFVSFHVFTRYVKVTFFRGTSLRPVPAGGKAKEARWIDIHEDDFDEKQMVRWIRQAAAIPGWLA